MVPANSPTKKSFKYTYGPVPSRRLGLSLGIDIIPYKNCTFDCIYCQLGKTTNKTILRKEYTRVGQILDEVRSVLNRGEHIDYLTFSGSGEPTLHKGIGYLINEVKRITEIPIAVLTNGSLLSMPDVRHDLVHADVVLPTLCTTNGEVFQKIHRSHEWLDINKIIDGFIKFRNEFNGKIWLEIMLIKGINDESAEINEMKSVIDKIRPDKIHLNTVVRPPTEKSARPVALNALRRMRKILGENCEIIIDFKPRVKQTHHAIQLKKIISMIERRPVTIDYLVNTTGLNRHEILKSIGLLLKKGKIATYKHDNKNYYRPIRRIDA
jgi:wyosine [tRNA(Phe)-imidazoG37] synthetase (radical SAM superfamily)